MHDYLALKSLLLAHKIAYWMNDHEWSRSQYNMPNNYNKGFIFVLSHVFAWKASLSKIHSQVPLSFIYVYIHVYNLMALYGLSAWMLYAKSSWCC